ncbi:MAG: NPCBM/NEW2 domain-containing protein [Planctomycetes bacterium]|nr:NPCBM/NEW2 domain-containing protein [Planctomycetota bacterium]
MTAKTRLAPRLAWLLAPLLLPSFAIAAGATRGAPALDRARTVDPVLLLLRDGSRLGASAITFGADGEASVAVVAGGMRRLPLQEIVSVEYAATGARTAIGTMTARLHDGSRLLGKVVGGDEEEVQFELATGNTLAIPLDALHALFVGPRHAALDVAAFAPAEEGDTLHRRLEVGGDHTRGTLVALTPTGVRFDYSLGTGDFRYDEVEAVVLEQQVEPRAPKGVVVEADLLPDGTLIGELVRLTAAELVLKPLATEREVALPREALLGLRLRDGTRRWLSDLAPVEVRERPYLGGADDFLHPWRRDRSVTGQPLQCGGRRFGKGLGCHSRSELSFALPASARRFVAVVGISDEVLELPERGAVEFRVLVDGVERWKSGAVRGGEPAQALEALDVSGGKVLTLIADFGSGEDVADRAVWGEAVLLD